MAGSTIQPCITVFEEYHAAQNALNAEPWAPFGSKDGALAHGIRCQPEKD